MPLSRQTAGKNFLAYFKSTHYSLRRQSALFFLISNQHQLIIGRCSSSRFPRQTSGVSAYKQGGSLICLPPHISRRHPTRESIQPPKQPFLSIFANISPSGKRSAIQKVLLAHFSEPALCRIPPNGAHSEVSQNMCAGIQRICAVNGTMTLS